ncbi:amino acid ABC transporter substrate-binding protein [Autumnicola psychrophila]|uniref:LysM peptidoglycan-binding domain-containing protein n=1 Tax=Autumnicola psychrophila TaxID=3075592 RepID=A0ABU3DR36_9FLAO|nr:LysM peptidoglycan-binding domain-containing protein [Zunongwangia sp. F225]MDT0686176.1 LysM peptidoglycan-binding domain-containing protein [Zunongwangia sp. F225]
MKYIFALFLLFQVFTAEAVAQQFKYHTVTSGETVNSIARSYNVSTEDIFKYNPDAKDGIDVSAKLVIPLNSSQTESSQSDAASFRTHKVAKKETLYGLSQQYNVEIDQIKRYNKHLYSEELQTGEEIRIPVISEVQKTTAQVSAAVSAPQQQNSGVNPQETRSTREHVVIPKETKYGIARKYGLTVQELEEMNPTVDVLQPGIMLKVGTDVLENEPVIITDETFEFYEVQPKENFFRLTRKFGIDRDSLIALNPALKDGVKSGMVLKIPADPETGEGDFDIENFEEAADRSIDLKNSLTNLRTKELVVMLPYNLQKIESDSLDHYKKAILEDRVLRISLDFYSGVLMAVEEAKELGISTNLRVFDTKQNVQEVTNIVNTHNFSNTDAVIGPLLQTTTEAAAASLARENVPVISPLSNKQMRPYDNLFQSRPTDEMLADAMVAYLERNADNKNVVVIADGKSYEIKSKLSNILPQARFISPGNGYVSESAMNQVLDANRENWVILESDNVGILSSVTSGLNRLARDKNIKLFTTAKGAGYDNDNVSNNHLGRLNFHYPSVDKQHNQENTREFIEEYVEKFAIVPNQYAVRGYDLTLDVLLRLASAKDLYDSFARYQGYTEYYENKFHYMPISGGGFQNDAVYILSVNEDLSLSVENDF